MSWDQVDGIMQRAARRGLARRADLAPRRMGVDETSFQKRYEYVTIVTDLLFDTPQRPAKPAQCANLLLLLGFQDVAHPAEEPSLLRRVNVPGSPSSTGRV